MEHGTSKHLVCKKEEIKCNSIITLQKMINFEDVTKQNIQKT